MKPNTIYSCPSHGASSLQSEDTHPSECTVITHETVMEDFHGLPGAEFEKPLMRKPAVEHSRDKENNLVYSTVHGHETQADWHQMHPMAYQLPMIQSSYQLSPRTNESTQDDRIVGERVDDLVYDLNWPQSYESGVFVPSITQSEFVLGYSPDTHKLRGSSFLSNFDEQDIIIPNSKVDSRRFSFSQSPIRGHETSSDSSSNYKDKPISGAKSSSRASDDDKGANGDENPSTIEGRTSDAPYAKLIYKALMEAPNHSMVLQDIYKWFIDNTEKGGSKSTGWRNSIRHNLSMNAAFRKTSRKLNGSDSKRTSEWLLEPFAVAEGVTPTTRYRKSSKKTYKTRNSGTRGRSSKSAGIKAEQVKFESHRPADPNQNMMYNGQYHTPVQQWTPVMESSNLSPYTPGYHHLLSGSLCHSGSSSSDGWEQYADLKAFQMDDGVAVYVSEHEQCGDRYQHLWTAPQYF